jgi:hypothetical protein
MKSSKVLYWFLLFAICSIAYQQVQDIIRPSYTGGHPTIKYLLGVAPNFFPSIGIPALFFFLLPSIVNDNTRKNRWLNEKRHITANLISITGLVSWEFLQIMTPKGHFDWHDVLWTLIGASVFQLIWTITPNSYKK